MAREVERKFLVSGDAWRAASDDGIEMSQFYLVAEPDRSVRVRMKDAAAILTVKLGAGPRVRDEFEYEIPRADADDMRTHARGRLIRKTRHHVRHRGHVYEVDVFHDDLEGLVVAELETEDDVPDGDLPPWLGREVTDEPAYYNAALATRGLPDRLA
jgi:adenylate cyclase